MANTTSLSIEFIPLACLRPSKRNARTHSNKQVRQIAESIRAFGFNNPILVDADRTVIAGHARLEAARLLKMSEVPIVRLEHMTEPQKRAYALADNRLAELAGWDRETLALEMHNLIEIDADFDLTITGFEPADIDLLLHEATPGAEDPADQVPEHNPEALAVTRLGDLWRLGAHRLLCGDATRGEDFGRLMRGQRARMVLADPPYNVPIAGHVSGLGVVRHREFAMAAGEMDSVTFAQFLERTFSLHARHATDGSIHFIFIDWRHLGEALAAGRASYSALKNLCVWRKTNAGMGSLYRSAHELVLVFKSGDCPHVNNVELGRHGRHRTNVWDYAGVNTFGAGRDEQLAMHPTVKPVQLVVDAILDCSNRKALVLDGFAGSGTTLIACERTGRMARLMEIDPGYCDTIIRRWEAFTGGTVCHEETGLTFAQLAEQRGPHQAEPTAHPDEEPRS